MTDIYGAGENPEPGITGKLIVNSLLSNEPRKKVIYIPKNEKIVDYLGANVQSGDLVLTLGAGDIWSVGHDYIEKYGN